MIGADNGPERETSMRIALLSPSQAELCVFRLSGVGIVALRRSTFGTKGSELSGVEAELYAEEFKVAGPEAAPAVAP